MKAMQRVEDDLEKLNMLVSKNISTKVTRLKKLFENSVGLIFYSYYLLLFSVNTF